MAQPSDVQRTVAPVDRIVVLSMLLVLAAIGLLIWLTGHYAIFDCDIGNTAWGANLIAFTLAALVGFCELISRYRDSPWEAASGKPGLLYIGCNGLAGLLALYLIRHFNLNSQFGIGDNFVDMALIAGFGAMIVIRSKLFTLRQSNGSDIAVGPAFAVDTFLSAVNREVDRARAPKRVALVAEWARKLRGFQFKDAAPILTAALAAFQDLDANDARKLRDGFRDLVEDNQFATFTDESKFFLIGFDIMTAFGEKPFTALFTELETYLQNRSRHGATTP